VALSLEFPPVAVSNCHCHVLPGLSSYASSDSQGSVVAGLYYCSKPLAALLVCPKMRTQSADNLS
jgi:hypothetical protein